MTEKSQRLLMAKEGLAGLALPLPGRKRDFSRDTLQAGLAMPTRWKVVDAVFPFTAALPSTCCVPTEHRGPAPTATEPSARSPPQWAAGVGRTWEVEVL